MPFILTGNVGSATAATTIVNNSLRFDDGSNDWLSKSFSSAGNKQKQTISVWIKRGTLGSSSSIFSVYYTGSTYANFYFNGSDQLQYFNNGGSINLTTNRLFRDISAWYHIVLKLDTTDSTADDRIKMYVNGVQETSFAARTNPSVNAEVTFGDDYAHYIGTYNNGASDNFDGYMSQFVFTTNVAYDPTSFGEFDSDSPTIWKPIEISGLTFNTNAFFLDFEDSSTLGNDVSGNNNNFSVNNLTSVDQSTDTCENNFATLNPLANLNGSATYSEGNLKVAGSSANNVWQTTFVVSSGKWYWELKDLTSSPDGSLLFYDQSISSGSHPGYGFVLNTKKKVIDGSVTGSAIGSSAQNDIWSMALDLDNGKMFIARNGTYLSSGDPANGTNPFIQTSDGLPSEGVFGGHVYDGSMELNFGGGTPTSISSGNADGNGYGNFEYAVPSGFYSLNTKNLAEFG